MLLSFRITMQVWCVFHWIVCLVSLSFKYVFGFWMFCYCIVIGFCNDKNHTRMTYHFVCCLSFVLLILEEISHGIKNGPWTPTVTDHSFTSHFTMTSLAKHNAIFIQWWLTPSTKLSHIIPQGPHHLELFERFPVGFLLKSTGNQSRSGLQD